MIKSIYLLLAALMLSISLNAQDDDNYEKQGSFYLTAGMNLSRFVGDDVEGDVQNRLRPYAGIGYSYTLTETIGLGAELLYSSQGFKSEALVDTGFSVIPTDVILSADYLSIPINVKVSITEDLKIDFGPSMNMLINEETEITALNFSTDEDVVQNFYFGAHAGLSFNIVEGFGAQLRYNRGLSRVFKDIDVGGGVSVENKVYSSFFSFGLTYSFK
jgi:opacity protein-like surface antigen